MTPKDYLKLRNEQNSIIRQIREAMSKALKRVNHSLPKNLRPAESKDIVEGAIIWYKSGDEGPFWTIVEEVYEPEDSCKGYCADDGCRYGLDDAYIEI